MKGLAVSVRKLTDEKLLREACETTFNGVSHATLLSMYRSEHSPARTQIFWVRMENLPLCVASHLVRHHVGTVPFQLTCRPDRKGGNTGHTDRCNKINEMLKNADNAIRVGDFTASQTYIYTAQNEVDWLMDNTDRNTPVKLSLLINAQGLIDMAKVRLCNQASRQTRDVCSRIKEEIAKVDPDLASMMVPKCVYRCGLCGEPTCCGYNSTDDFMTELRRYAVLFSEKQRGIIATLIIKNK